MTEPSPVVSVIMPTYGNRGYLAESVRSVLDQTFTDFELLIVDDCSREPIKVGSDDPRIRVLRHVRNQGPAAARNTALPTRVVAISPSSMMTTSTRSTVSSAVSMRSGRPASTVCRSRSPIAGLMGTCVARWQQWGFLCCNR